MSPSGCEQIGYHASDIGHKADNLDEVGLLS